MLSVHGTKARIMIAHFNLDTMELDLKCSNFKQFDGFEKMKGQKEDIVVRVRHDDFSSTRDLFFRWLNPICKGDTYLKDSEEGPGMVLEGKKGRKQLVPRKVPAQSPSTDSSQSLS